MGILQGILTGLSGAAVGASGGNPAQIIQNWQALARQAQMDELYRRNVASQIAARNFDIQQAQMAAGPKLRLADIAQLGQAAQVQNPGLALDVANTHRPPGQQYTAALPYGPASNRGTLFVQPNAGTFVGMRDAARLTGQKPPDPSSGFAKVTPKDYTPESIRAFVLDGRRDYSLLVPRQKPASANLAQERLRANDARGRLLNRVQADSRFQGADDAVLSALADASFDLAKPLMKQGYSEQDAFSMALDQVYQQNFEPAREPWYWRNTPPGFKPGTPQLPAPQSVQPPIEGARQAPDGNWYVPDPDRPGKYLKVTQ